MATTDANFNAALAQAAGMSREIATLRSAAKSSGALNAALARQVQELEELSATATQQIIALEAELEDMEDACLLVRQQSGSGSVDPLRFETLRRLRGRTASILQTSASIGAKIESAAEEMESGAAAAAEAATAEGAIADGAAAEAESDGGAASVSGAAAHSLPALDDPLAPEATSASPRAADRGALTSNAAPKVHISRHGSVSIALSNGPQGSFDRSLRELVASGGGSGVLDGLSLRLSPATKRVEAATGAAHFWRRLRALATDPSAVAAAERALEVSFLYVPLHFTRILLTV